MDTQKAIDCIEKSEHIGILLPKEPNLDVLCSAEVIMRLLEEREKQIGFLISPPSDEILRSTDLFKKILSTFLLPKEFIVSLDTTQSSVSQLRYEKQEGKIDVVFSPKSTSLVPEAVSFREGKLLCDSAITLGIADIETVENLPDSGPNFFQETPLINIDNDHTNKNYGEANLVNTEKTSLTELVYEFISSARPHPLDQETATLLLTGILYKTRVFQASAITADALLASSELMRLGANFSQARDLAKESEPLRVLQLSGRASVRSKIDEARHTLWSFLTAEDFEKTNSSPEDASAVMARLDAEFPPQRVKTLLWQDPEGMNVRALIAANRETLGAIRERVGGDFASPYLLLATTFPSFPEAEKQISLLLDEVL